MVLVFALFACLKAPVPVQSGNARQLVVANVMDSTTDVSATGTPAAFDVAVVGAAGRRKLVTLLVEGGPAFDTFTAVRDTSRRITALKEESRDTPLLLVETAPVFFSELNGQYRWTVAVHVSLVAADGTFNEARFDVPVFLQYHHQREAEAVDAASPVVERRVGEVIDTWLSGGG
ncbi:hypothetical protein LBMAG42_27020 [Deltaproteobacteria bacterium]|nr:hypothetical protein LBMAG42_27020 [Deltaproteobacteria bacterium]